MLEDFLIIRDRRFYTIDHHVTQRAAATYRRRPSTWAGPIQTTTASACVLVQPLASNAGIMCAHSAAVANASRVKHSVNSQKARSRSASCSVWGVLSVAALRKTEEIEKLAKRIRGRLRRF